MMQSETENENALLKQTQHEMNQMNIRYSLSSKSNKDSFILIALQRTLHDLQQLEMLNIHITFTEIICCIEQNIIQLH